MCTALKGCGGGEGGGRADRAAYCCRSIARPTRLFPPGKRARPAPFDKIYILRQGTIGTEGEGVPAKLPPPFFPPPRGPISISITYKDPSIHYEGLMLIRTVASVVD